MTFVDFVQTCKMYGDDEHQNVLGTYTRVSDKGFLENVNKLLRNEIVTIPMRTIEGNWLIVTRSFLDTYTPIVVADKNVSEEIKNKVK